MKENELCHQIDRGSNSSSGGFLAVQWLSLHASSAGDTGLTPGWGTEIPYAMQRGPKENKAKAPVLPLPSMCCPWASFRLGGKWSNLYQPGCFFFFFEGNRKIHSLVEMRLAYYLFLSLWVSDELFSLLHISTS